jgi:integrase
MVAKKKVHGEGSVFERKDDRGGFQGGWTDPDTKQRHTVYAKTEKECWQKLEAKKAEAKQRLAPGSNWTFERFIEWWLEAKGPKLSANTLYRVRHFMKKYGFPTWGKTKLINLTPEGFQNWVNAQRKLGKLKPSSIRQYFSYVHAPLEYAVKMRMLSFNPCQHVELPTTEEEEETAILIPAQAMQLVEQAPGIWGLVFLFGIGTAARRNEILAARWGDVNFATGEWEVKHNYAALPGETVEGKPKTKASQSTIMLPPFLLSKLIEHQHEQKKLRLKAGSDWENKDLIFCNDTGGFFHDYAFYYRFKQTLKKMGMTQEEIRKYKPHSLRHGTITWLLDDGQNPREVQCLARHSTLAMTTDRYGKHKMPGRHEKMMMRLDEIVKEQQEGEKRDKLG